MVNYTIELAYEGNNRQHTKVMKSWLGDRKVIGAIERMPKAIFFYPTGIKIGENVTVDTERVLPSSPMDHVVGAHIMGKKL